MWQLRVWGNVSGDRSASTHVSIYFILSFLGQSGLQPTGNALQSSLRDISAFPTVWGMG